MKQIYCILVLMLVTYASAEDTVKAPAKKELIPAIPHIWISGNLLYFKAQECRTAFANQAQDIATTANFTKAPLIQPHFEWNPGVRIELGYQPKEWMFFANWTNIQNKAHGIKATDGTMGFSPIWTLGKEVTTSNYVTSANFFWKLNLEIVDLGASYPWKPAHYFILKPHMALRTAFLGQKFELFYGGGFFNNGTDMIHMTNNFFGIGPEAGLTPNIVLGNGFSLLANISSSALIGRFFIRQREKYLDHSLFSHSHSFMRLRWTLDFKTAIAWQKEFIYKALVFGVQVGWEWHKFYRQNELMQNHFHLLSSHRNLILRGGFISLSLGF